jgi:hypothetical protein
MSDIIFELHDVSGFPIVRSRANTARPGYAPQWEGEMEALLARAEPFVIIFEGDRPEEAQEDRKHRGIWLKKNKLRLSAVCKALISIEENDLKRMAVKAQSAMAERAFGIPMMVVASPAEADIAAKQKLDRV